MPATRYCPKCRKTMAETNFYTYKDGTKCELCKPCLTMHINNYEPDTFLWLLEKFDVPYIEGEWNILRDRAYQKDPYKMNGMSVFGKYLSKMKLKQWKEYSWADTERLKQEEEEKAAEQGMPEEQRQQKLDEMKQAFENGEITEAQYLTYAATQVPEVLPGPEIYNESQGRNEAPASAYPENNVFEEVELVDLGAELTDDDKVYLAMKWGIYYKANEWVKLEQLYKEFMESFDIQGAARLDTLKMICKTSLKMNDAIDTGDVDTYQKLSRVYDAMMKSAKFTEAQKKEDKSDFVDCVGSLVAYCEKEGGRIPKYEITEDYDVVDTIINDLKEYNKNLIYEDKALAQEIEDYLKNREIADQMKRDREEARKRGLEKMELTDQDYIDFQNQLEEARERDQSALDGVSAEEGELE